MSHQTNLDMMDMPAGAMPPDEVRAYAIWQGYLQDGTLKPDIGIDTIIRDLKRDFDLAPIQAMAVYARLKGLTPTETD